MIEIWPPPGIDWYYADDWTCIACADCRDVLPKLPKVDLCLTDPPYGINADNRNRILSRRKLASATDYGESDWDSEPINETVIDLIKQKSDLQIIWGGNFIEWNPASSCWLVWDKLNGDNDFADCELAWTNLKMAVRKFEFLWNGMIRAGEQRGVKRVHPTQKPVELMRWCLNFVPDAKTVLDPYMGSGTTLRAAKDLGRRAIGIEISEKYAAIAKERLRQEVLALK